MKIVDMQEHHIAPLEQLEQVCFSEPWSQNALREELQNPAALFLVAENDKSAVLGYIGCQTVLDEGYITNVAVAPGVRQQGIAKALVGAMLDRAQQHKLSFVTLEVRVSNAPAIALYQKAGFYIVGTRRNYYSAPKEDALLMTKDL